MSPALAHAIFFAPIALAPVLLFLMFLLSFDSYKLVSLREVFEALVSGLLVAVAAYVINGAAIDFLNAPFQFYSRYEAPLVEEALKALFMLYMIARNRIGFMIDAAVIGFAAGTGFGLAENMYALWIFQDANAGVFIVRGFGTAIMHGGTIAIFGVMAQSLVERHSPYNPLVYLPGLLIAVLLHFVLNYFQDNAFEATAAMLLAVPVTLWLVFARSEHKIHTWLLNDYETHEHLLADIESGRFADGRAGRFIRSMTTRFGAAVAADIFAYLKLHTELVLNADRLKLARERNEKIEREPGLAERFKRLHALERKIGRTAMLAIWPHLHFSRRELWELHELELEARS